MFTLYSPDVAVPSCFLANTESVFVPFENAQPTTMSFVFPPKQQTHPAGADDAPIADSVLVRSSVATPSVNVRLFRITISEYNVVVAPSEFTYLTARLLFYRIMPQST